MAEVILLPIGTTGTNEWKSKTHGIAAASNVNNDDDDTDYIYETTNGHEITFTMANPSVAESAIDSITSVKIILKSAYTHSVGNSTRFLVYQTGTGISNGFDTHNVGGGGAYGTYSGAAVTTSDGSSAWTYADLENLQVKIDKILNTFPRTEVRVSYLYAEVTYVEVTGYGHDVLGVDSGDIGEVNGVATANIGKVISVD